MKATDLRCWIICKWSLTGLKNMKKIIIILLLTAMLPLTALAKYENTHVNTDDYLENIIAVATTQLGYKEGSLSGEVAGHNDCTKYGAWYPMNYNAWCAMFVSWCADQAGIPTTVIPKHASCDVGMQWFIDRGRFSYSTAYGGSYSPKRGDIVYFGMKASSYFDSTHVGIVHKVDSEKIYVLEGNSSDKVQEVSYKKSLSYILGYGKPDYSLESAVLKPGKYITNASVLNFREEPNTSCSIIGQFEYGTLITITEISNTKWGKTSYNGKTGWVSMDYCTRIPTVSYNANGGTNAPSEQAKPAGEAITLSNQIPTRSGYTFLGWSSSAKGSAEYQPGDSYTKDSSITLYAVWQANKKTFTLTFKANGGTSPPSSLSFTEGQSVKLSYDLPKRTGYTFEGWAYSATAQWADIFPGQSYDKNKSATLYAVWSVACPNITVKNGQGGRTLRHVSGNTMTIKSTAHYGYSISYIEIDSKPMALVGDKTEFTTTFNISSAHSYRIEYSCNSGLWINPFNDVNEKAWYYPAIEYCFVNDIMTGTAQDRFAPASSLTRGQFVTLLGRLHGVTSANVKLPFTDISKNGYYYTYLCWAYKNGIVSGVSQNSFAPNSAVTREQLCVMLYNYAVLIKENTGSVNQKLLYDFTDHGKISSWAREGVAWAVYYKYLNGSDGMLKPRAEASRAQTAQIIYQRYLNLK